MKNYSSGILYWIPRILSIIFILLISLFALDVFGNKYNFQELITALLIHLIPSFVLLISLLIAWKWELAGGIIFILLGLSYIISLWGMFTIWAYITIAGPVIIAGILFIVDWIYRKKLSKNIP